MLKTGYEGGKWKGLFKEHIGVSSIVVGGWFLIPHSDK
jgi:hypothetical protein